MRTSHRQIRKRILDAKSKISDEEFFSSRAYNGYLTDLAEAATKRYKRPLRVRVVADHDDDTNPYWVDMREAMDRFTLSYDYTHLSTFYADLVEYIVMTVRLYFFIREKQFRPIDREKYDELVGVKAALPTPA